ncbi:AI-2E family transporter [Melioribacteraceae bacterium 4301-Me]|uniref:AI-2E family transporter n=1 Tax=Pyranulibacter aquaticus TaxID=3163344 RepID=UPI003597724D
MQIKDRTSKKYFRIILAAIILFVLIYLSYIFYDIIIMITISLLVSLIFNPFVNMLEKMGFERLVSSLIVLTVSALLIVSGFWFLIPKIVNQFNAISKNITHENIQFLSSEIENFVNKFIPFVDAKEFVQLLNRKLANAVLSSVNNISNIVSSLLSLLALFIIVPFMTFFFLKDNKKIVKGIINIMPNKYFEVSYWVIRKISISLGKFVRGWIFDAVIVGVLAGTGLAILGVNNAMSIGFVAGVGHLIPYFGPIIGGIPAILISVAQFGDLSMLPKIVILFIIVYAVDNGFIQPNIYSKSTDLHPLVIIILIIMGSQLMGIFGMLLAVPTATVIKTAAKEIYYGYKNYRITRV